MTRRTYWETRARNMADEDREPPRPAGYAPGFDEEDPYEAEDIDTYPD